jgi:hypothetical protein
VVSQSDAKLCVMSTRRPVMFHAIPTGAASVSSTGHTTEATFHGAIGHGAVLGDAIDAPLGSFFLATHPSPSEEVAHYLGMIDFLMERRCGCGGLHRPWWVYVTTDPRHTDSRVLFAWSGPSSPSS